MASLTNGQSFLKDISFTCGLPRKYAAKTLEVLVKNLMIKH